MVRPNASRTATVRSFFVIDPARRIGLMLTCPMPTGRNFDEILRAVESLQFTANRTPGEDVVVGLGVSRWINGQSQQYQTDEPSGLASGPGGAMPGSSKDLGL